MGTIIVIINFIIVILSYVEYFSRNSTYIDFGKVGSGDENKLLVK